MLLCPPWQPARVLTYSLSDLHALYLVLFALSGWEAIAETVLAIQDLGQW
ncbi:MAG: hypothetical protein IBX69_14755 [Anaerolineales bacterium]|nr:hypothetical protein [Anaerolineales bacterium]